MNKLLITWMAILLTSIANGQDFTGVYSFNKGLNKPNGILYFMQFAPDSAFLYLSTTSGNPDFLSTDIKGMVKIDSSITYIKQAAACRLELTLLKTSIIVKQDTGCQYEYTTAGTYKKTSHVIKRSPTMVINYTEKPARAKQDSLEVFVAPSLQAKSKVILCKENDIKIIDEFNAFFLIEHKKYKTEFMWVQKKNLLIPKK